MSNKIKKIVGISLVALALISCQNKDIENNPTSSITTMAVLDTNTVYFFGHQSVGENITDGLSTITAKSNTIREFNLSNINSEKPFDSPGFYHCKIGENRQPMKKISDFISVVTNNPQISIAGMKFCYVDVVDTTNIAALFNDYTNEIDKLISNHPNTIIFHSTVPLRKVKTGFKTWIKETFMGKEYGKKDNIAREKFNQLIRNKYDKAIIFDLAKIEATNPEGTVTSFKQNNDEWMALSPVYTNDGGHLNDLGQATVAKSFIAFLSSLKQK